MPKIHLYFADIIMTYIQTLWLNFYPFVWGFVVDGEYGALFADGYEVDYIRMPTGTLPVDSVEVDDTTYTETTSITTLKSTAERWYYDPLSKLFMVHFEDNKTPWDFDYPKIGQSLALMKSPLHPKEFDGVIDNKLYANRLLSTPSVPRVLDNLFSSQQADFSTSISWDNNDGFYDTWAKDNSVYGNFATLRYGAFDSADDIDSADLTTLWRGRVRNSRTGPEVSVSVIDPRYQLDAASIEHAIVWDGANSSGEDITVPEAWGMCYRVPCAVLNPDGPESGNFYFMIALESPVSGASITSIDAVYVNGAEVSTTADTTKTIDGVEFHYIGVASSAFASGSSYENLDTVTADVDGYAIDTAPEIIKNKLNQLYNIEYNTTNFDTTNWAAAEAAAATVGLYIGEPTPFNELTESLSGSDLARFKWGVDGKFRYYIYDDSAAAAQNIFNYQIIPLDAKFTIEQNNDNVVAAFRVGRNRKWYLPEDDENAYDWDTYSDSLNDIYNATGVKTFKTFRTLINGTAADTDAFGSGIYDNFGVTAETIQITVKTQVVEERIEGEFIAVQLDYQERDFIGWYKCEIREISPDTENNETRITLRLKEETTPV